MKKKRKKMKMRRDSLHSSELVCKATVVRIRTPEGKAFLIIDEDPKTSNPIRFDLQLGKSGTALRSWSYAMGRMLTLSVLHGATIEDVITELSNVTTDKYSGGVRSGIDGLVKGLMRYQSDRLVGLTAYLDNVPSFGGI